MGKILTIMGGTAAVVLGVSGLVSWWWSFVELFKGAVPCFLIMGGLIALFAGISELKDELSSKKEEKKA
ncbi:MAG: hypothetical protein COW11_02465 [Candidatus Omnitrophica bacterium CG12_big_fil_rev_8_21_14_0_65_43_15]|uniref:Uncharacterized protein n=1 Tax=Candidatus Taenaricola geysiri TaxID=1974752 RepID=A0A2J0LFH7_9BACT|nr:MAG: hypothetical protein AUJ89_05020 [Candidatus Omnitrophica bacterium CG1_02_43_210]PIV11664.1 MAG: hypothetical protein COS48_04785 [Candidatus Omnitrophica bacterium CG03_land_8_20_14_0_80_43_22]PIW66602.1 MAG: hypothetical protein COW11_02465 [Candidatus Omnitrophica bacterium CG12_big_fil_rev_8_21_14_0_65_43_15]PIW80179.1 MAG: hypothetical protein COZ98_03750 [Candidatus Omnitrophica bacterium CG_4_8_14_3_um_filter_43_15]PJC46297.1 MAG: hypothetical protein CO036_03645 [Candidatus Omn